jgi:hypothetical protein
MIQIPKLLGTSLSIREDEAEDGVQAWTRPLGSGLPVSAKMKQRRTTWRRGRVPSAPACPKLQAYDLTADEPDGAGDVRPGRVDVRRRRGGEGGADVRRCRGGGTVGMFDGAERRGFSWRQSSPAAGRWGPMRLNTSGGCVPVNEP